MCFLSAVGGHQSCMPGGWHAARHQGDFMAMTTKDRAIAAVSTVLLAVIGLFAGLHYAGGSENQCNSSVCGDGNNGNTVAPQGGATR